MHAGSFEYIGVRHRATQTLYLSDLIKTHTCRDPGYGKLHIGLYIAALEDAEDRVMQLCKARRRNLRDQAHWLGVQSPGTTKVTMALKEAIPTRVSGVGTPNVERGLAMVTEARQTQNKPVRREGKGQITKNTTYVFRSLIWIPRQFT
jgi:hypothetical protein